MRQGFSWKDRWVLAPFALLSLSVASVTVMITLARGDGQGAAAEPDYYRKAVQWDEIKAQRAANDALGWVVTPTITAGRDDPRCARLEVVVADKYTVEIAGASVEAEVIPIRAADARVSFTLSPMGGGRYGADVPVRVGGTWECRVSIVLGERKYADQFRRHVTFSSRKKTEDAGVASR